LAAEVEDPDDAPLDADEPEPLPESEDPELVVSVEPLVSDDDPDDSDFSDDEPPFVEPAPARASLR
jgi:hypothetical protein